MGLVGYYGLLVVIYIAFIIYNLLFYTNYS